MKGLFTILLLVLLTDAFGQRESFHRKTYDTLMTVRSSFDGSIISGKKWLVRITMDSTYLYDIARDSNLRRRVFVSTGGKGEVATGTYATDTALINRYAWEYWHNTNGFDYSVRLNNGIHYPVLVTVLVPATMRPWYWMDLFRQLKTLLQPRGGKFDVAGLSEGSHDLVGQIPFANGVTGNTESMSLIGSFINLEGVNPETFDSHDWTVTAGLQKWATTYGGKSLNFDGSSLSVGDSRTAIVTPMNAAVPGSAYWALQNYGGGGHCCWNSLYDPSVINFRCVSPITNANIVSSSQNTMGNYSVDPTTGTNLMQWMMRQGDTTMVGASCAPIVNAGPSQIIYLPQSFTTLAGLATAQCGHSLGLYTWSQLSGPAPATIGAANSPTTGIFDLVAGTYIFQLQNMDNSSQIGVSQVTVTVNPPTPPTASVGGPYVVNLPTSLTTVTGTSAGVGGATVTSVSWTYVSGPGGYTIISPTSNSTVISGLVAGSYVFRYTAFDNNGNSSSANASITVNGGSYTPPVRQAPTLIGPGEYQCFFIGPDSTLYGASTNAKNTGTGGTISSGIPKKLTYTPSNLKFVATVGSLHSGGAIDALGNVWMWGEGDGGQIGDGNVYPSEVLNPVKLLTDTLGNPFNNVVSLVAGYAGNAWSNWYAIKQDGTLWIWGLTYGGMKGNGSTGDTCKRPTQILIPGGRKAKQVVAGAMLIVLCTDGTVWTSGGNGGSGAGSANAADLGYAMTGSQYLTLHQLTGLSNIIQVAGGIKWNYALSAMKVLYGWGSWGNYLGRNTSPTGGGSPIPIPTELTEIENAFSGRKIWQIVTNSSATHVILEDSTLHGWGDNPQGNIGNGEELYWPSYQYPWSFDLGTPGVKLVTLPVNLAPGKHNFIYIVGGSCFNYYSYAEDVWGQIYGWGRNKGGVLVNGIIQPNTGGTMEAKLPNTWDVPLITPMNPLAVTQAYIVTNEGCVKGILADTNTCKLYNPPTNIKPTAILTVKIISGNRIVLDGGASTDNVHIMRYEFTQTAGTPLQLGIRSGLTDTIAAPNGTYTFKLKVTDNGWLSDSTTNSITVSTITAPNVSAGNSQIITLPTNSVILSGSASGNNGATITDLIWTKISGPGATTILGNKTLTATALNLQQGAYVFQLQATDSNGLVSTSIVTITVNAPNPGPCTNCLSYPKRVKFN